ncbi:hypothetical protein [Agrococcus sp. KRD186]|uniref:hypothetical protein n=1 Tax=Agrococcus sp. KRD186 TaxID=2729730 RepID=UPI0019D1A256|nr:hypothetical protein [Agrococcus sp. KRD186]
MTTKRTLRVNAYREGRWWVFEIPELDTGGQAASLAEIAGEARGGAAAWLEVDDDTIDIDVHVHGIDDALAAWAAGMAAEADARAAQAAAAAQKRSALVELTKSYGLSAADAGRAVGISKQRVYQIVASQSEGVATTRSLASKSRRSGADRGR